MSIFHFIDLMMVSDDRRGKYGFNFTQVETGLNCIQTMDHHMLSLPEAHFDSKLMQSEIQLGIHKLRRREVHRVRQPEPKLDEERLHFTLADGFTLL